MAIPTEALDLIKEFEGYLKQIGGGRVVPYRCPAGVPTIGWGTTFYPGGRKVSMADPAIDQAYATECLAYELRGNERDVDAMTAGVRWNDPMRGAVISFVYNVGSGAYRASTLRKKILAGQWNDVPREFAKWNKGGGRVLAGLTRRRTSEASMFMRGVKDLETGKVFPGPAKNHSTPSITTQRESWWTSFTRKLLAR